MKRKITFFFMFVLTLLTTSSIIAQQLEENFEYAAGDPITIHQWTANGNPGSNAILVVAPGLEFDCYAGSGLGNAIALNNSGPDAFKYLSNSIDTNSAYVSFMVKITSAQEGDYFFHLSDSTSGFNSDIGRVYARDSAGKFAFGLNKEGNNNEIYTAAKYLLNTTYLVVIKYTFVAGNDNDLVSLFVFTTCPPISEPPPTLGPMGVGQDDLPEVGKVTLRQGSSSHAATLIIDGIYVDRNYETGALPVELSAFTSSVNKRDASLYWTTASELNNSGFEIERTATEGTWSKVAFVNGNGTSSIQNNYSFTDRDLSSGKYNYRLKQIDYNGNFEYFNLSNEVVIGVPSQFDVSQNYPNPFNPSTKINYDIPVDGKVSVKIFDMSGKEVASLVNGVQSAGYYTISFNANNLSSGIYFYNVNVDGTGQNFVATKKMILVK